MFKGIFSTPPLPFINKKLNLDLYDNYLKWQKKNGVDNIYILGTWGGHGFLSFQEKKKIIESICLKSNKNKIKKIVNISSLKESEVFTLADIAKDSGAEAVSILLPQYYSTAGYLQISDYKRYVNRLCKKISLPIYIYNNPRTMSVLLKPEEFVELCNEGISGVKDGSKDLAWIIKTKNIQKKKNLKSDIIPGNTLALVYGFLYGCKSVMSGTATVYPKSVKKIYDLINKKKIKQATAIHEKILIIRSKFQNAPPVYAQSLIRKQLYNLGESHHLWPSSKRSILKEIKKLERKFKLF